jgi:glycosyltransferase involved in cell wall biosynthesis
MKITVLLNNYNYGRFLATAIDSVLNQTYGDFELIVVDDGSTDNSQDIIREQKDSRILPIFKKNNGQGSAFKAGIARASGDYIAFLDSDDLWEPNKLERCAQILRAKPDVVLLNHSFKMMDADGNVTGETHRFQTSGDYDLMSDLRRYEVHFSFVSTSFFVGRRRECAQVPIDEARWRIAADTPIIIGLGLRGKIYNLAESLGFYRAHGANLWFSHVTNEFLVRHFDGVYRLVNEEMERMGRKERYYFANTELAMNQRVLECTRYSLPGIYHRIRKRLLLSWRSGRRPAH